MNNQFAQTIIFMLLVGIAIATAFHYMEPIAASLPDPWNVYFTYSVWLGIIVLFAVGRKWLEHRK